MDLLDRHGQGLDEASSGGTPNTSITCAEVSNRYRGHHPDQVQQRLPIEAAANLVSLRRIQALFSSDRHDEREGSGDIPRNTVGRTCPDAAARFKGVRMLLEQNLEDISGSETVAIKCLEVLAEAVNWLARAQVADRDQRPRVPVHAGQARLQGPGHELHTARACIASILPPVIDCFARKRLREPAHNVLTECVRCQGLLPDVPAMLVDQLVSHGMEHDEHIVRLWSTSCLQQLLVCGLALGTREYSCLLEGLVGRVQDVNDGVVDAAARTLQELRRADPERFVSSQGSLGPVHQKLLHHFGFRIRPPVESGASRTCYTRNHDRGAQATSFVEQGPRHSKAGRQDKPSWTKDGTVDAACLEHAGPSPSRCDENPAGCSRFEGARRGGFERDDPGEVQEPMSAQGTRDTAAKRNHKGVGAEQIQQGNALRSGISTLSPLLAKDAPDELPVTIGDTSTTEAHEARHLDSSAEALTIRAVGSGDYPVAPGRVLSPRSSIPPISENSKSRTNGEAVGGASLSCRRRLGANSHGASCGGTLPDELTRTLLDVVADGRRRQVERIDQRSQSGAEGGCLLVEGSSEAGPELATGSAASRRERRIVALEGVRRRIVSMDEESVPIAIPRPRELIVASLKLAEDSDFKIALLALQILLALVVRMGGCLEAHLAVLFRHLAVKLGDHKVAVRHHAMAILSALVRTVGLTASVVQFVKHGMQSASWRIRKGSLKLVIVGLLRWQMGEEEKKRAARLGGGTGVPREIRGSGWGGGNGVHESAMPADPATEILGRENRLYLLYEIGQLLVDKEREVQHAAVEALAVAAQAWKDTDRDDVVAILEREGVLRSTQARHRLASRLREPPSSLPTFRSDYTLDFGSGAVVCLGEDGSLEENNVVEDVGEVRGSVGIVSTKQPTAAVEFTHRPDPLIQATESNAPHTRSTDWDARAPVGTCESVAHAGAHIRDTMSKHAGHSRPVSASGPCGYGFRHESDRARRTGRDMERESDAVGSTAPARLSGLNGSFEGAQGGGCRREEENWVNAIVGVGDEGSVSKTPDEGGGRRSLRCWRSDRAGNLKEVGHWEGGKRRSDRFRDDYDNGNDATMETREMQQKRCPENGMELSIAQQSLGAAQRRHARLPNDDGRDSNSFSPVGDDYVPSWIDDNEATEASLRPVKDKSPVVHNSRHDKWVSYADSGSRETMGEMKRSRSPLHRSPAATDLGNERQRRQGSRDQRASGTSPRDSDPTCRQGPERGTSPLPDPRLLSALKGGPPRNSRGRRRAVSATVGVGSAYTAGVGSSREEDQAVSSYAGCSGRSRPRGGMPAEPTTPIPVGSYDGAGRRHQMETTMQQPLPLAQGGEAGGYRRKGRSGHNETFLTGIYVEDRESCLGGNLPARSQRVHHGYSTRAATPVSPIGQAGSSATSRRRRERAVTGADHECPELEKVAAFTSRATRCHGRRGSPISGDATVLASSPASTLKGDSSQYLTTEDVRPLPNPSQELQRATASLSRDDWPEIFHTLNSVRRLATHHAPLLSSQPHVHTLVREVLGHAENLRSQVAKNALLTLADLWRGLRDSLNPELTMVCPLLVKKMADKVEFLAEAARECVDEVVKNATDSRALSAFLSCGNHRSPMVRAKAALAVLLCIIKHCAVAEAPVERLGQRAGWGQELTGGVARKKLGARELERLLSTLPRFLQDGNQETRSHAKAIAALLLDSGEVDESRLRREIPAHLLERLQRDLLNSSFASGSGSTAPSTYRASAEYTRGLPQGSQKLPLPMSPSTLSGFGGGDRGIGSGWVADRRNSPTRGHQYQDGLSSPRRGLASTWHVRTEEVKYADRDREMLANVYSNVRTSRTCDLFQRTKATGKGGGAVGIAAAAMTAHSSPTMKRSKACKEAEMLPGVFAQLDSSDWRERLSGLQEGINLLQNHGDELHAAGKSSRLLERMAELLADGNLKINILALDGIIRLAPCLAIALEPVVNTLVPAVCKCLASSNQQLVGLGEKALDALCDAIDPCLLVQPVASLAQYGNIRLKVPMLDLLRNLTPVVGRFKPKLLTKYVRPVGLVLVRENRVNVRDAGLSLLRSVELALESQPRGTGAEVVELERFLSAKDACVDNGDPCTNLVGR